MRETSFGAETTTDQVLEGVDLAGTTVLVTGASSGLGYETARALHAHGASVILAARDASKLAAAANKLRAASGDDASEGAAASRRAGRIATLALDLADRASIRSAAAEVLERFPKIDRLINNAGVMACPLARTAEGLEWQFGVNHIGHFLFTCSLVPALRRGEATRVVNLSSAAHKYASVDFDDVSFERRAYDKWLAYGQSKTANVLFSVALTDRLARFGIVSNAVHPGAIATELGRHLTSDDIARFTKGATPSGRAFAFKTIPAGAATSVFAATSTSLEGRGGLYLEDCGVAEEAGSAGAASGYLPYARDPELASRLWTLSEELVGERFPFA